MALWVVVKAKYQTQYIVYQVTYHLSAVFLDIMLQFIHSYSTHLIFMVPQLALYHNINIFHGYCFKLD